MAKESFPDTRAFNEAFLRVVHSGNAQQESEMLKAAADGATQFTRRRLREDAFSPAILPYDEVSNADLDKFVETEHPMIICEMEPDSFGSYELPMSDSTFNAPYYGNKYLLKFHKNATPEWQKDVNLLRTYGMDLREIIVDNGLRDLARMKDHHFMTAINNIVGITDGAPSPKTGLIQNVVYPGRLDRQNWVSCTELLGDRSLTNGVFLCNRRTFAEIRRWGRDEMGGDFSQDLMKKGTRAFESSTFSDIDFIVTFKIDIVPNGVLYQFAPPNFLGKAAVLQQPTMYVKKEKDILTFSCEEMIGVAIANMAAVEKVTFQDVASATGGDNRLPSPTI